MNANFMNTLNWSLLLVLVTAPLGCGHIASMQQPGGPLHARTGQNYDHFVSGRVHERKGDWTKAVETYQSALLNAPDNTDLMVRLAIAYDHLGQFDRSSKLYQNALKLQPGNGEVFCDMGYSLYLQRRWSDSEANFKQALAINPDLKRAHNNLGLLYGRINRPDDALAHFHQGGCNAAQAHANLALMMSMEGRSEQAQVQYELALKQNPDSQVAREGLARLTRLGKWERYNSTPDKHKENNDLQLTSHTPAPPKDAATKKNPLLPASELPVLTIDELTEAGLLPRKSKTPVEASKSVNQLPEPPDLLSIPSPPDMNPKTDIIQANHIQARPSTPTKQEDLGSSPAADSRNDFELQRAAESPTKSKENENESLTGPLYSGGAVALGLMGMAIAFLIGFVFRRPVQKRFRIPRITRFKGLGKAARRESGGSGADSGRSPSSMSHRSSIDEQKPTKDDPSCEEPATITFVPRSQGFR